MIAERPGEAARTTSASATGEETEAGRWARVAAQRIPGGSSTGSKRPEALYGTGADDPALPRHMERGRGAHLWAADGRRFLDLGMALGAVGIGYADAAVTAAVCEAAAHGPVGSLPHRVEPEVAERLAAVIPCAEQVRFLRTGAEAGRRRCAWRARSRGAPASWRAATSGGWTGAATRTASCPQTGRP